jgi:hypothetical protein
MAVSIDTVYQRVLAILNKEQRGYVTPQEFNLFANQAQLDIFEQYFYDINQFGRMSGNDTEFSDMLNILNEKVAIFETRSNMTFVAPYWQPPADIYRMGTIILGNAIPVRTTTPSFYSAEIERVNYNEFINIIQSPMTRPSKARPIYWESSLGYQIMADDFVTALVSCSYVKKPTKAEWAYQMVYGEALYDSDNTVDFELHPSEETELVIKILEFAGLAIKDVQMYQIAAGMEAQTNQQEKS